MRDIEEDVRTVLYRMGHTAADDEVEALAAKIDTGKLNLLVQQIDENPDEVAYGEVRSQIETQGVHS